MRVSFNNHFTQSFRKLPQRLQKAFGKQLGLLLSDLQHPSLHSKKYDQAKGIWQARVDGGYRFYFRITGDIYEMLEIRRHD